MVHDLTWDKHGDPRPQKSSILLQYTQTLELRSIPASMALLSFLKNVKKNSEDNPLIWTGPLSPLRTTPRSLQVQRRSAVPFFSKDFPIFFQRLIVSIALGINMSRLFVLGAPQVPLWDVAWSSLYPQIPVNPSGESCGKQKPWRGHGKD